MEYVAGELFVEYLRKSDRTDRFTNYHKRIKKENNRMGKGKVKNA